MIEIHNLEIAYDGLEPYFISGIRFEKGKISTILGKNGSGKTTFLRAMVGILPYRGSIRVSGKETAKLSDKERAKQLAYLPQMIKAVNLDVETLVSHGRYPYLGNNRRLSGKDREIISEALALTEMEHFRSKNLAEISGGELRRAYLAMVIAQDADMILLDEPTAYLDIKNQNLYYSIIKILAEKGKGIVQTCHNVEQGLSYSDHVAIMGDHTIKLSGTPEEVRDDEQLFRSTLGFFVKGSEDPEQLYSYTLIR